jgi:uncharacterized protein YigE (DUF2233 family)
MIQKGSNRGWKSATAQFVRLELDVKITGVLFILLAWVAVARADWKLVISERESSLNEPIEHWKTVLENEQSADRATLHTAAFSTHDATLRIVDQPETSRGELAEVLARARYLGGVNGGYFDPTDAPVGLLVSDGRVISPLRKARLLSGVLLATATRVDVVRVGHFSMSNKIRSAVQCGPLLVERSAPVAGLNDTHPARRTFAAVDGNGHAALGVCSAVSLAELGKILCLTNVMGKMKVVRALNLDGGSSSAFWFAGREGAFSIPEQKIVRDFVAIVAR